MALAEFIDIDYLKKQTAITANVDAITLEPFIYVAQQKYIKDLIGSALYNELQTQIVSGTTTQANIDLLEQIAPALAWYTYLAAYPYIGIKTKNKGNMISNDSYATSIDLEGTKFMMDNIESTARFLGERVVKFLVNYSKNYPSYTNQGENPDIYPKSSAYRRGIYLPNSFNNSINNDLLRRWLK